MKKPHTLWHSVEAAIITGGRTAQEWTATGIALRLSDIKPGDMFFAAPGDSLDEAMRRGAAALVLSHRAVLREGWPVLKVADPFEALKALARAARYRTHGEIIAVQNPSQRGVIGAALRGHFNVFEPSSRHLSQNIASIPEMCDFALLGWSPHARPDIAVISDCLNFDGSIIDTMQPGGRVLIHAQGRETMDVMARARAAGIRNIFTYGQKSECDAAFTDVLMAANGTRVSMNLMGDNIHVILPTGAPASPDLLSAALILKLSELSNGRIANAITVAAGGHEMPILNKGNLAIIHPQARHPVEAAFRVKNVIDVGRGQRTLVLDGVTDFSRPSRPAVDLSMPHKIGSDNLVYACRGISLFSSAENVIQRINPAAKVEAISHDVLSSGDFLTVRGVIEGSKQVMTNAMRLVYPDGRKTLGV